MRIFDIRAKFIALCACWWHLAGLMRNKRVFAWDVCSYVPVGLSCMLSCASGFYANFRPIWCAHSLAPGDTALRDCTLHLISASYILFVQSNAPCRFILGLAPPACWHISGNSWLLAGQNVEYGLQAQHEMLRFVAMEVPESRHGCLESNHGPASLP